MKRSEFERWLFRAERLTPEQEQALANTLVVVPELRALAAGWRAAEADLQRAAQVGPDPGFTERWRLKLASAQARRRQRQVGLVLSGTLTGAFGSLAMLAVLVLSSPAGLAAALMETAITIHQQVVSGVRVAGALIDGFPLAAGVLLLSVTLAWLSVIWFATLYRFAFQNLQNGERK